MSRPCTVKDKKFARFFAPLFDTAKSQNDGLGGLVWWTGGRAQGGEMGATAVFLLPWLTVTLLLTSTTSKRSNNSILKCFKGANA